MSKKLISNLNTYLQQPNGGWLVVMLLALSGAVGYLAYYKLGFTDRKIFTEYKPIRYKDTIALDTLVNATENQLVDTVVAHSPDTSVIAAVQVDEPPGTSEVNDSTASPSIGNLFKVNTEYDEISIDDQTNLAGYQDTALNTDALFEELLLSGSEVQKNKAAFAKYARKKMVPTHSVFKLLAIVGKRILSGKGSSEDQEILEVLMAADQIQDVLLVDRQGRVVYATNQKHRNAQIKQLIPQLDLDLNSLTWFENDNRIVTAIPVFHTYGKIGTSILVTDKD